MRMQLPSRHILSSKSKMWLANIARLEAEEEQGSKAAHDNQAPRAPPRPPSSR